MLRLLQDLYEADVLAEETFTKWRDDVKEQTEGKVHAELGPRAKVLAASPMFLLLRAVLPPRGHSFWGRFFRGSGAVYSEQL